MGDVLRVLKTLDLRLEDKKVVRLLASLLPLLHSPHPRLAVPSAVRRGGERRERQRLERAEPLLAAHRLLPE